MSDKKSNSDNTEYIKKQGVTRSNPANKSFEKEESSKELKTKLAEKANKEN